MNIVEKVALYNKITSPIKNAFMSCDSYSDMQVLSGEIIDYILSIQENVYDELYGVKSEDDVFYELQCKNDALDEAVEFWSEAYKRDMGVEAYNKLKWGE